MRLKFAGLNLLIWTAFVATSWSSPNWGFDLRVEIKQEALTTTTPSISLIFSGTHDFKDPLRLPVNTATPDFSIRVVRGSQLVEQTITKVETSDVVTPNVHTLVVQLPNPQGGNATFEVRLNIVSPVSARFQNELYIDRVDTLDPPLYREFQLTNQSGIDWSSASNDLDLMLIETSADRSSLVFNRKVARVPPGRSVRLQQRLVASLDSLAVAIDPASTALGRLPRTLTVRNGVATSGPGSPLPPDAVYSNLSAGAVLRMRVRESANQDQLLPSIVLGADIPVCTVKATDNNGTCHCVEIVRDLNCMQILKIGTRNDIQLLQHSFGPEAAWLPVSIDGSTVTYLTGRPVMLYLANTSDQSLTLTVPRYRGNNFLVHSYLGSNSVVLSPHSSVRLGQASDARIWLINLTTSKLAKPSNPMDWPAWLNTIAKLRQNLIDEEANMDLALVSLCTHPAVGNTFAKLSEDEIKKSLASLGSAMDTLAAAHSLVARRTQDFNQIQTAQRNLRAMRDELQKNDTDANWRQILRIDLQQENLVRESEKIQQQLNILRSRKIGESAASPHVPVDSIFKQDGR